MQLRTLLIVFVITFVNGQDRKIVSKLNPGCDFCNNDTTLIYVRAEGSSDTLHQIWDFSLNVPTILYVVGGINSSLDIVWEGFTPAKFVTNEKPKYSFAAAIDKLVEYNDLEDNGHYSPKTEHLSYPLRHMFWTRKELLLSASEVMLTMHGRFKHRSPSGSIDIKVDLIPFKDYAVELPHLIHTANSTLVDVSLVNITTHQKYNSSRFALQFLVASGDSPQDSMQYTMRKSLDDEHTPGVFEIIEIKTPESVLHGDGGFLQFRPVAYTQPERGVSSSTNAYISNFNRTSIPERSILNTFYRRSDEVLVQDMFISFGLPGDGFYKQHNFTEWSFTFGYGTPPVENFSLFVIIIISIGLGVPVFLSMSGIIYVVVKRYKQRNAPARFTDDE